MQTTVQAQYRNLIPYVPGRQLHNYKVSAEITLRSISTGVYKYDAYRAEKY